MPHYEYACSICQYQWESEASIKAPPETLCPKCQQESAKRLISSSSFVLNGGGWAREGYGK